MLDTQAVLTCFSAGYTTDILLDALTYNEHSGKAGKIDLSDVELAVQAKVNWEFKESGERDVRLPLGLVQAALLCVAC
jgi:hypothetical protein